MSKRQGATRSGKQPPRYRFFLNPYPDMRFTLCPICQRPTLQRKLPLVIHIDPMNVLTLNKTCRYCRHCDLLIAHQDELEEQLAEFFARQKPEVIGNDYLVLGTMDRATGSEVARRPRQSRIWCRPCTASKRCCASSPRADGAAVRRVLWYSVGKWTLRKG